jgi:hypothetical protein
LKYYPLEFKTSFDDEIIKEVIVGSCDLEVVVNERHVDPKKTASYAIANSDQARAILLKMMSMNEKYSMSVWSLIKDLNKDIVNYKMINNLKPSKQTTIDMWKRLLNPNDTVYELLWNLHDIKKLLLDNIYNASSEYTTVYINHKLLTYLIETYRVLTNDLREIGQVYTKIKTTKYTLILLHYFLS